VKFRFQFLSGARAGQLVEVPGPMARFGRDPQNEVACDAQRDDKVSTFHAQLLLTDKGELLLSDLGSSNGTFVDGQQLSAPVPIATGAIVSLGGADDGIKIQITILPDDPAPAPEETPPPSGSRKKLMIGGILLLVVVLAISVGVALSSEDPDPSPTPTPTSSATESPGPSAAASATESSPAPSAAETPAPSEEPAVPSPEPSATPEPATTPSTVENPWKKFGVGTYFVLETQSVIKVGENTIETKQTMTQTLKSISDTVAEVEMKVESDQLPQPSVTVMKLRFDEEAAEGPEPVETRTESLAVPAGKFDDVTYTKFEQVMNGQKTVTESWTHKELPVGLKTISKGATSTTTSTLIKIELKK
jgi:FHA domain-containing protein